MKSKLFRNVDGGWARVVLVATFFAQMMAGILLYSYGIIQIVLLETFHGRIVETSWILSITSSLLSIPGPLAGILANLTSCRTTMMIGSILIFVGLAASAFVSTIGYLYLTLAFLSGLGTGLVYSPSLVVLCFYFDKHLNMATGFAVTGGAIGMMAGPPLTSFLYDTYGWRGMFLLLAAVTAHFFACSLTCSPSIVERTLSLNKQEKTSRTKANSGTRQQNKACCASFVCNTGVEVILSWPMLAFYSSVFLWSITMPIVCIYLPSFTLQNGATISQSSLLFTAMGICNLISRTLTGIIVNKGVIDQYVLYIGSFGLMGLSTIIFPFMPSTFTLSAIYASLFGICTGGPYVVLTTITKDIAGLRHLAIAYGVQLFVCGAGFLLGPPIAGRMVESSGLYTSSFVFAGVTSLGSSFLGILLRVCHRRRETEFEKDIQPTLTESAQLADRRVPI